MINVIELKIGNYVEYSLSNIPQRIKSIIFSSEGYVVNFLDSDFANVVEKIKPIPITEEWLLSFGFNKSGSTIYKNIGRIEIGTIANGKRFYIQIGTENVTLNTKYVHQLQNLYFAITGDELVQNGI